MMLAAVAAGVADAERAREALAEVVRRRRLQRLSVAHQRLERVGVDGAGKPLALALATAHHGDREDVLDRVRVDVMEDRQRLRDRLLLGLVRRVPFLPEELGRAQEEARPQLPADDVRPLVVEQGQIAVRLHPAGIRRPDQRLGGGTHRERLVQLLPARLGDDGDLGCEPFDQLPLLRQHRRGHEQREVHVLVAGCFDPVVELALDRLPDRIAVRLDHHRAAHGRVLGEPGAAHDLAVPGGEVTRLAGQSGRAHRDAPASRRSANIAVSFVDVAGGNGVGRGAPGRSGSAYAGTCTNGGRGATAETGRSSSIGDRRKLMLGA